MLLKLLNDAQTSSFKRWLLNQVLWWKIPFNSPHSLRIVKVEENGMTICLPFKRRNKNHINGMHACALATLCEYITGLMLARTINAAKYRFILQNININYKYQAKKDVMATFALSKTFVDNEILSPLQTTDSIVKELEIHVFDTDSKLICIGLISWQIKKWDAVKTKV